MHRNVLCELARRKPNRNSRRCAILAKLVCLDHVTPTPEIVVNELPSVIGRSKAADVHIEDAWASRVHCAIDRDRQVLVVRDLDSRNGTFVNGRRIDVAQLRPGDRLTIGASTFAVDYDLRAFTPAAAFEQSRSRWEKDR